MHCGAFNEGLDCSMLAPESSAASKVAWLLALRFRQLCDAIQMSMQAGCLHGVTPMAVGVRWGYFG